MELWRFLAVLALARADDFGPSDQTSSCTSGSGSGSGSGSSSSSSSSGGGGSGSGSGSSSSSTTTTTTTTTTSFSIQGMCFVLSTGVLLAPIPKTIEAGILEEAFCLDPHVGGCQN